MEIVVERELFQSHFIVGILPMFEHNQIDVEVGRIRQNLVFGERGLEFFVCGDQLLRRAALNAVEIAEVVVRERFC